jgi:hypothetical protein
MKWGEQSRALYLQLLPRRLGYMAHYIIQYLTQAEVMVLVHFIVPVPR